MKKALHILLVINLLSSILMIGKGVDLVRCSCSGQAKVVPCGVVEDEDGCDPSDGCLDITHIELSPAHPVQPISSDSFVTPIICMALPAWNEVLYQVAVRALPAESHYIVRGSPPRDYLNLIQILLI
ncbi:MAG: hypothetical protein K6E86_04125 [Bacteroidales bacterium]|nr:hypothetical protein [Bacteroidales bacterium]